MLYYIDEKRKTHESKWNIVEYDMKCEQKH